MGRLDRAGVKCLTVLGRRGASTISRSESADALNPTVSDASHFRKPRSRQPSQVLPLVQLRGKLTANSMEVAGQGAWCLNTTVVDFLIDNRQVRLSKVVLFLDVS